MHDDREENLPLTPPASGSHHGTVPVIAGVDLPGLGDVPQSGSEPQASKPEILAPAEPPRPLHSATKTPPQLDLDLLLARGNQLLALGDVASARLFYRLAATKGSAEGAVAMGSTYDPVNLERAGIAGVRPSPAEAIKWYRQAIDMGHQGAGAQLRELTNSLERATTSGTGDAQPNLENTRN